MMSFLVYGTIKTFIEGCKKRYEGKKLADEARNREGQTYRERERETEAREKKEEKER